MEIISGAVRGNALRAGAVRGGAGRSLRTVRLGLGALGVALAFLAAPAAVADETDPTPSGASTVASSAVEAAGEQAGPSADSAAGTAVAPAPVAVPVSHLPSPDNLPPGTTDSAPQPQSRLGYLRDVWQAIRSEDVTMSDALLILAQRPLDANATPPSGVATGPSGPVGTSAPAAVVAPAAGADTP